MPNVAIDLAELSGLTPGVDNLKDAVVWFYPFRPYGAPQLVTTDKLVVDTVDGVGSTFLPETPVGNGVYVEIRRVRLPESSRKFIVPIPAGDCNLFDLPHLDPTTLDPEADPEAAWWAAIEALDTDLGNQVVSGAVVDGDLILTKKNGGTINAGHVQGDQVLVVDNGDGTVTITVDGTGFTLVDNGDGTATLTLDGESVTIGGGGGGSGDVAGPSTATDNGVARFDTTTGKLIQNSLVTISDTGAIATPSTVDGRDVSVDGTKLDGIASGATANSSDATLLARANHTGTESADVLTDGTTNKAFLATERTKLSGIATGATANSTDATLLARANHTGTESADVLTDGTTNKAFLATERTKLAGIATSATANSADATLLARANHTGTQTASTISDFSTAADARVTAGITGKADTASPTLTGDPKAPTPTAGDNDTSIATTAFVETRALAAVVDSIADADTTHAPSRNAVFDALAVKAPLFSPVPTLTNTSGTTEAVVTSFVVPANTLSATSWLRGAQIASINAATLIFKIRFGPLGDGTDPLVQGFQTTITGSGGARSQFNFDISLLSSTTMAGQGFAMVTNSAAGVLATWAPATVDLTISNYLTITVTQSAAVAFTPRAGLLELVRP